MVGDSFILGRENHYNEGREWQTAKHWFKSSVSNLDRLIDCTLVYNIIKHHILSRHCSLYVRMHSLEMLKN